jgi:hypothetical protein
MWIVIYMTQNLRIAKQVCTLLSREGILVKMSELGQLSTKSIFYEILVLELEAEEAQVILIEQMNL